MKQADLVQAGLAGKDLRNRLRACLSPAPMAQPRDLQAASSASMGSAPPDELESAAGFQWLVPDSDSDSEMAPR